MKPVKVEIMAFTPFLNVRVPTLNVRAIPSSHYTLSES